MDPVRHPHDALFKETLSNKENARSFLANYLPKEVLPLLDLEHIEIEKDSFVTATVAKTR
jgi:predicted transposase/invertase (TIGR01784 family)